MESNGPSKQTLAHFLDNKNFPTAKRSLRKRRVISAPIEKREEDLIIVNGEVVVNDGAEREILEEDRVTSFSYGKAYTKRGKWSKEETLLFYQALSLCGTDFTLLGKIFTDKERRQLKNKFSKEEKESPEKITFALANSKPFTKEELVKLTDEYSAIRNKL
ncbi:hypothetical protein NEHOM01_0566 [Nematocida homosporus]|uniref:uncharacterized protein n=1 Tax=Nematocida homosporus TaxID=1912981 RepID=UPI0022205943|nr:uncharacterized protein NEHOM01_0566 [Nematocida homosporus]KAI5185061.1 hypothetical protein NEHOM01_0566 [Nematocida homosporus]